MFSRLNTLSALAGIFLAFHLGPSTVAATEELTLTDFNELHQQLQVASDAPWRTIPWKTAMLDAQRAAAEQAKPIFIWAMDGHPLGCT